MKIQPIACLLINYGDKFLLEKQQIGNQPLWNLSGLSLDSCNFDLSLFTKNLSEQIDAPVTVEGVVSTYHALNINEKRLDVIIVFKGAIPEDFNATNSLRWFGIDEISGMNIGQIGYVAKKSIFDFRSKGFIRFQDFQ